MSAVRAVETLMGLRIDHMVQIDLDGFTAIVDVLGGVGVDNRVETAANGWHFPAGALRLTGASATAYLTSSKHSMTTLERTQAVFVEIVQGLIGGDTLTNPAKVENIGDVLNSCVTVDAGLTAGEIRRLALDMQLSADAVTAAPLPLAGVSTWGGGEVIVPDQNLMRGLANALRAEQPRVWVAKQADPWAPLAQLPPR